MPTTVVFPHPKDPADDAWYSIRFWEPLASIVSATSSLMPTQQQPLTVGWKTPGDSILGSGLTVQLTQISTDGFSALVLLAGGTPGAAYAVRVGVITVAGNTLYRTVILKVAGA
jgi:hypothetical protein